MMTVNTVLKEANSIHETLYNFNKEDKNPYKKIKNTIINKEIRLIVTIARGSSDSAAFIQFLFICQIIKFTYL